MQARLVPLDGREPFEITRDTTLVGRQEGVCDLVVDRASVSKLHCLIVRTDGLLYVRDLGSTNGTKVNGQRVVRGALLPGDVISIAGEKFTVELGPPQPDRAERTEVLPAVPEDDEPLSLEEEPEEAPDEGSGEIIPLKPDDDEE